MNEIINEFKKAFMDQVLKKTWFKVVAVLLLLLLGFVIYKVLVSPEVTKGEIGNKSIWTDYESLVSSFGETSKTLDGVEADVAEPSTSESSYDSREIESVLNELFVSADLQKTDLFAAAFTSEQLNEDFFQFDLSERFTKMEEVMNGITRDGKLERIDVVRGIPMINNDSVRVVLDIFYSDLSDPVRLSVIVRYLEQYQFNSSEGETMDFPFIDSSAWDMLDTINKNS